MRFGNFLAATTMAASTLSVPVFAEGFDSYTFGGLRARSIGPALMSGRIAAMDADAKNPSTVFVGAASGGVWRSDDGGLNFEPVFDDHIQSIGAITIDPNDSSRIWVGTGETWVRNSVSVGNGIYLSEDGGDTWTHKGLTDSERIAGIRVSNTDSNLVYVCATGHLWNANEMRGVYRSNDGGESWKRILYIDEDTGCADIDLDPERPQIIYAAMWEFRRYPDFFTSGGPGSGLFRSVDGGESWQQIEQGLPEEDLGRIAIAVAPSQPATLYANVESSDTALYRSDDMGNSWQKMNTSNNVQMRPFYFSELLVDPTDHMRVYKPGYTTTMSDDGGASFSAMFGSGFTQSIHPDHHAMWINPNNPHQVMIGTDGGLYVSENRANSFRHVATLPISQFYHVSADTQWPYFVYGGLQDNGSWRGPSRASGGITARHWDNIGYGDGFWAFADPNHPEIAYSEYQGGLMQRVNRNLGEIQRITPVVEDADIKLRFNWNTPMVLSRAVSGRLYAGSQYVHRSDSGGADWQTISPDLTTNDPDYQRQQKSGGITTDNTTAENFTTLYTIVDSPLDENVIWAGSDDGLVHVTRDGGESWKDVTGNIPDLPRGTWVSRIESSPFNAATAFATMDGHRRGDMNTYVYRTDDYGQSWQTLVTDEIEGYAWVIRQDVKEPDLLFVGTEFGLYVSLNGGQNWARFQENLPKVAVHDIDIQSQEGDLVIGTHGRGVYIIDDLSAMRALSGSSLDEDRLLPSRASVMVATNSLFNATPPSTFVGENPSEAAVITYYLKRRHLFGDLKLNIYDANDELITSIPGPKRRGINRVEWPMRLKAPKFPASTSLVPGFFGPRVAEGTYRVELIKGKKTFDGEVQLIADPRSPHSADDRKKQHALSMRLYEQIADLTYLSESILTLADDAESLMENTDGRLHRKLKDLSDELRSYNRKLTYTGEGGVFAGVSKLRENIGDLYGQVTSFDGKPSTSQQTAADQYEKQLRDHEQAITELLEDALPDINRYLEREELSALKRIDRDSWEQESEAVGSAPNANKHFWTWLNTHWRPVSLY